MSLRTRLRRALRCLRILIGARRDARARHDLGSISCPDAHERAGLVFPPPGFQAQRARARRDNSIKTVYQPRGAPYRAMRARSAQFDHRGSGPKKVD